MNNVQEKINKWIVKDSMELVAWVEKNDVLQFIGKTGKKYCLYSIEKNTWITHIFLDNCIVLPKEPKYIIRSNNLIIEPREIELEPELLSFFIEKGFITQDKKEKTITIEIEKKAATELIEEICFDLGEENCYRGIEVTVDLEHNSILSVFAITKDKIAIDFAISRPLRNIKIADLEERSV